MIVPYNQWINNKKTRQETPKLPVNAVERAFVTPVKHRGRRRGVSASLDSKVFPVCRNCFSVSAPIGQRVAAEQRGIGASPKKTGSDAAAWAPVPDGKGNGVSPPAFFQLTGYRFSKKSLLEIRAHNTITTTLDTRTLSLCCCQSWRHIVWMYDCRQGLVLFASCPVMLGC